jgi:hypothetical protein
MGKSNFEFSIVNPFVYPVVIDNALGAWYPPGTPAATVVALGGVGTWDNYVSPVTPSFDGYVVV